MSGAVKSPMFSLDEVEAVRQAIEFYERHQRSMIDAELSHCPADIREITVEHAREQLRNLKRPWLYFAAMRDEAGQIIGAKRRSSGG